jgi:hypothetical protein
LAVVAMLMAVEALRADVPATNTPATNAPSANGPVPSGATINEQVDALQDMMMKDEGIDHVAVLHEFGLLREFIRKKDVIQALYSVQGLEGHDLQNHELHKALLVLAESLDVQAKIDKEASEEAATKLLDHATKVLLAAKAPEDMDGVVTEVQAALDASRLVYAQDKDGTFHRLESANHFVKDWQNYLSVRAAGDHQDAAQDLRTLADKENTYMPVPRSEILRLADKESELSITWSPPPPPVDYSVFVLRSFDDIEPAIAHVVEFQKRLTTVELNGILCQLQILERAKDSYDTKNFEGTIRLLGVQDGGIVIDGSNTEPRKDSGAATVRRKIALLKNQLLIESARGILAANDPPPPKENELPTDYLERLAQARKEASDWPGLQQVLEVEQMVYGGMPPPWLRDDLSGIRAYLMGQKMEQAGQTLDAIRYYRQALATLGRYFPGDPPAGKLDALKKSNPDLYQKVMQQPLAERGVIFGE